jgi:hypothetical protein
MDQGSGLGGYRMLQLADRVALAPTVVLRSDAKNSKFILVVSEVI